MSISGFFPYTHSGKKKRAVTFIKEGTFRNVKQLYTDCDRPEVWIMAEEHCGRKICFCNLYREWGQDQPTVLEEITRNIEKMLPMDRLLIAGDFNLDMSRTSDPSYSAKVLASRFMSTITELGLHRVSFGRTFQRVVNGKVLSSELDWTLSSNETLVKKEKNISSSLSDHDMIVWNVETGKPDTPEGSKMFRNLGKIDRVHFARDLSHQPWEQLAAHTDMENMATAINNMLLKVVDAHAPWKESKVKPKRLPKPSQLLLKLRRQRDNARSKGNITKLQELRAKCKKLARKERFKDIEKRIQKNPQGAWNVVSEVTGAGNKTTAIIIHT